MAKIQLIGVSVAKGGVISSYSVMILAKERETFKLDTARGITGHLCPHGVLNEFISIRSLVDIAKIKVCV